jgi:two-component system sensor histidine kinase BaeS
LTRRLIVAIVGMVAGALLLAGLGTLVLTQLGARQETRRELEDQAVNVAASLRGTQGRPAVGEALRRALRLQGALVVTFGPRGDRTSVLPAGVADDDLDLEALTAGEVVSGTHGNLVYAAAQIPTRRQGTYVVALTREADTGLQSGGRWFVLAAIVTLGTAIAVAAVLGSRLTRPLRDAQQATRRIARGDLSARVPEPRRNDELAALTRSINEMAAALERSRGLERQFLLSVSHDLRTPLTSIRGYAEAIAEGKAPDTAQAATVIITESRRLERLVRDLLELAKLDARRFSLDVRATDVAEVVNDTAEGFRPAADDANVVLDLAANGTAGLIASADPDRVAQVVANLIENALKFAAGNIAVRAARENGAVVISVADDGPGIAAGDLPYVFERFFTSTRTPARQVGSGLGLAIVRELVDAMGGTVRAEPADGRGARMVVALKPWAGAGQ